MAWAQGRIGVITFALMLGVCLPSWGFSPRYSLYAHAQLMDVEAPNLVKLKIADRQQVVTVRLLGVGSPRNRDRIRGLDPEVQSFIARNDMWEVSRNCVKTLLGDKTVEIWARKWDPYDDKHRLLAYIRIPHEDSRPLDVNAEIIKRGLGFVTRDYVHVTYVDYRYLEDDAKKNRRGMWKALSLHRVSSLNHNARKWNEY